MAARTTTTVIMPEGELMTIDNLPTFNAPDNSKAGRLACHKLNPAMAGDTIV
eukprot:COSAG05_NODE_8592_length_690_cov_0.962775_1_plen_51_part_10